MSQLTLDELIANLESSVMSKQASEDPVVKEVTSVSAELEQLLTKSAEKTEETPEMNKQAEEKGKALASSIIEALIKVAKEEQDVAAEVEKQAQANLQVEAEAALVAEDDVKLEDNPEGDVQEILAELIARIQRDAGDVEMREEDMAKAAEEQEQVELEKLAAEIQEDNMEKVAAVQHLVSEGASFEDAVTLVKQAEEELLAEQNEIIKMAAVAELHAQGVSIEEAITMVKQAESDERKKAIDSIGNGASVGAKVGGSTGALVGGLAGANMIGGWKGALGGAVAAGTLGTVVGTGMGGSLGALLHRNKKIEKKAEEEVSEEFLKQAMVGELLKEGLGIEEAIDFLKQANAMTFAKGLWGATKKNLGAAKDMASGAINTYKADRGVGKTFKNSMKDTGSAVKAKALADNKAALKGVGIAAAGVGALGLGAKAALGKKKEQE